MKKLILTLIAIICITTSASASKNYEWWKQFTKHHTVKEIVNAAYRAGNIYGWVNCGRGTVLDDKHKAYRNMTPLEKDMYFRIKSLARTETERCYIAENVGDYLI